MEHHQINNLNDLSNYLSIDKSLLKIICFNDYECISLDDKIPTGEIERISLIRKIKIPKKDNGIRLVHSPFSETLTNILKILSKKLYGLYDIHPNVHSYIKGRNIKSNANVHLAKKIIYQVDIDSYFDNITSDIIIEALNDLNFNPNISKLISKIVTHNNTLVQGFHTSPILANIVFKKIDDKLSEIEKNIDYSRYADDLYFSADEPFDINKEIKFILSKYGFELNENKTKYLYRGNSQYVTGLTVFDSSHPRIARRIKKVLRTKIHYINKYGYKGHVMHLLGIKIEDYNNDIDINVTVDDEIQRTKMKVEGWLNFIKSIEPSYYYKYYNILMGR